MHRKNTVCVAIAFAMLTISCDDDDLTAAGIEPPVDSEATTSTSSTIITTDRTTTDQATTDIDPFEGTSASTAAADTGRADTDDAASATDTADPPPDDTGGSPFGTLPHQELFEGVEGSPWPVPWTQAGTGVVSATLYDGQGRLTGATGQVARMVLPGFTESDVDVSITVRFDDWLHQGMGLYVRQNGGALQQTVPPGQGYAAYVEGGYLQSIGIWRETNGVEELLVAADVPGGVLDPGIPYRLRLQCLQQGASTLLRTRLWPQDEPEPEAWQVEILDGTPALQDTAGTFAVDLYNYAGTGGVLVDDLHAEAL